MSLRLFWDIDGTLLPYTASHPIHKADERGFRPHAQDVITALEAMGVENYLWSRAGQGNACEVSHRLGLPEGRCFSKPEDDTPELLRGIPVRPDLIVDDNEEESVLVYPHILVPTYEGGEDDALLGILPKVREFIDALQRGRDLVEFKVKFRRKKRIPSRVRLKRRKYYRRNKSKLRKYKRRYKRTPRAKRLKKLRKRLTKRFKGRLKRFRMRVSL